jgi:hypothetical protein
VLLASTPIVYGAISVGGGISASVSDGSSVQGNFAADNNVGTFEASSIGIINDFKKDLILNFGNGGTIRSKIALADGSIGACSEITKLNDFGMENSANLIALGSYVDVGLSGTKGSNTADQSAGVGNGVLVSSLGLEVSDDVSAYQKTVVQGDNGFISSSAASEANNFGIDGAFSGNGVLNTELLSTSCEKASMYGSASLNGNTLIDDKALQYLASDSIGLQISDKFQDRKGNSGTSVLLASNTLSSPATGEMSPGYKLSGFRWPRQTFVDIYIAYNSIPSYLDKNCVGTAFSGAKSMWGAQCFELTNIRLYWNKGNNPSYTGARGNGNTQAWTTALPSNVNARTQTWYTTSSNSLVKGNDGKKYYRILESDTWYNAMNYPGGTERWWLSWGAETTLPDVSLDVRTVVGRAFGFTFGLGELTNSLYKDQLMYKDKYDQVDWSLGKGDIAGIKKLYG